MAERNLDAFCADLPEYLAEITDLGWRGPYSAEGKPPRTYTSRLVTRLPITTQGTIGSGNIGFIYVAGPVDGRFKIGMSVNPDRRSREVGAPIVYSVEVPARIVRHVETEALRRCGQYQREGEWVRKNLAEVIHHVTKAVECIRCGR